MINPPVLLFHWILSMEKYLALISDHFVPLHSLSRREGNSNPPTGLPDLYRSLQSQATCLARPTEAASAAYSSHVTSP